MPYDLIEDNMALAIDYAFEINTTGITNYDDIVKRNDRIGISSMPGGSEGVNIAKMTGLSLRSDSQNKDVAMELIRYLIEESDDFFLDTVQYTYENFEGKDSMDTSSLSILLNEARRSIPAALYMYDGQLHGRNSSYFQPRRAIMAGQSSREALAIEAGKISSQFEMFKEDLESYASCIRQAKDVCR